MLNYSSLPQKIKDVIDKTIIVEGGYVNHPSDRGRATKGGITESVARKYGYLGDMKDLPLHLIQNIYAEDYWYTPKLHLMAERSMLIADEMFDTGVNMGTKVPIMFLQRLLNACNIKGTVYPDLLVDGDMGAKTLQAFDSLCKFRGFSATEKVVFNCLNSLQTVRYIEICENRPLNEDFFWGWVTNRTSFK
jgi:lysozyme family protein